MRKKLAGMKKSRWNGIFSLGLGTLVSQAISFFIQPVLTRILSPAELGQYAYIFSLAQLFIPISSLQLNTLIVTSKSKQEADDITFLSLISVGLVTLIYIIFIFFNNFYVSYSRYEMLLLITLNPLIIVSTGIYYVFMSRNNRDRAYSNIAKAEISKSSLLGILQIIAGIFNFGVFGQLIGRIVSPIYFSNDFIIFLRNNIKEYSFKSSLKGIRKYRRHIIYSVPSQFINTFSYTLIMISIVTLYSPVEVGYYSISVKVLGLPVMLVAYNFSKVYLQKISEDYNKNKSLFKTFKFTIMRLGFISIGIFLIIALTAPLLTEYIFGEGFREAGIYIAILCAMFSLRLVTSSVIGTFVVLEKQNVEMISQILFIFVGTAILFYAQSVGLDIYSYLSLISIFYGIVYLFILIYIGYLCKVHDKAYY